MRTMGLLAAVLLTTAMVGCGEGDAPAGTDVNTIIPANSVELTPPAAGEGGVVAALPQVDLAGLQRLISETAAADRVLVIDFWATWCEPCKALFPPLKAGLEPLGEKVRKVTVTLDTPGKYEARAIEFLMQHHATADAYLLDPDGKEQERVVRELGDEWNTLVVPAILVFDRDGKLAGEFFGGEAEPIVALVEQLTATAAPQG